MKNMRLPALEAAMEFALRLIRRVSKWNRTVGIKR